MSFTEATTTLDVFFALSFFLLAGIAEPFIEHHLNGVLESNHVFHWSRHHLLTTVPRPTRRRAASAAPTFAPVTVGSTGVVAAAALAPAAPEGARALRHPSVIERILELRPRSSRRLQQVESIQLSSPGGHF